MKLLITLLCIACSWINHFDEIALYTHHPKNILDSVKSESKVAWVEFHHQVQKKSLVCKMIYTKEGIDSLFKYIGQINDDTTCLRGGLFNYFGQINLYTDSSRNKRVAELHFVLEGNCAGFYLEAENYLRRYDMTLQGKEFLLKLYNKHKNRLK
jgi:hypothetical protein